MKNMKKIVALFVAVLMLMSSFAALAADGSPADATITDQTNTDGTHWVGDTHYDTRLTGVNDGSLTIKGLASGDIVKFFRVLAFDDTADMTIANAEPITENGTDFHAVGWKLVAPFTTLDISEFKEMLTNGITSTLAGKIAKSAVETTTEPAYSAAYTQNANDSGEATVATADPGLYVAMITPANAGVVYNPVFVSSDFFDNGTKSNEWTLTLKDSYANVAMAKKSEITLDKEAVENVQTENEKLGEEGKKVDDAKAVAVGDVIDYTVKTTIPEFANNYLNPLFVITDLLDSGLALEQDSIHVYKATVNDETKVWTAGDEITAGDSTFAITAKSATGYKITFKPQYLLDLSAAQPIMVTYKAAITEKAITNVNEKDNTVTLEYSHKPDVDQEGEGKKLRDKTHHYTFTIDGEIWGSEEYFTTEIVKIGLDKYGNEIMSAPKQIANGHSIGALQGAEFKLYVDEQCKTEYNKGEYHEAQETASGNKILSDENGRLYINGQSTTKGITGLDAGTYYLREEKAPAGYIKQQAPVKIEIIPHYFDAYTFTETDGTETFTLTCDDVLEYYEVKIDNETTGKYFFDYPAANTEGVRSTDEPTAIHGDTTKSDAHGDIYIGNTGPIIEKSKEGATDDADKQQVSDDDGKIKNVRGSELPSTGGMGTTILYIGGSILVILAAVLLITKRRMNAED